MMRLFPILFLGFASGLRAAPPELLTEIVPVFSKYCYDCHDGDSHKGGVNFEEFDSNHAALKRFKLLKTVKHQVESGVMPPRKKPQPDARERALLIAWIDSVVDRIETGTINPDPGRVPVKRMSRTEYLYTIRDLFGLQFRLKNELPADAGGAAGFDNSADALIVSDVLVENYIKAANQVIDAVYRNKGVAQRILYTRTDAREHPVEAAKEALLALAFRAYRRPVTHEEVDPLMEIFTENHRKGMDFATAIKPSFKAMLMSPRFVFRMETSRQGGVTRINEYELASRLSYFIWSSMPDKELFAVAKAGKLRDPAMVERQVARMLKSPKASALARHFGGQWLGYHALLSLEEGPDRRRFPEFDRNLRLAMYTESLMFFDALVRSNDSLLKLLHANHTYLNEQLARHYGIGGVQGASFRKVALNDPNRGGVLGMGSVLTLTSLPLRTSPVKRGNWIISNLLGTPTPPPPPDAGILPADDTPKDGLSFRESLVEHRRNPNCAGCHNRIDPLGFGLENFDAIGRWRTASHGQAIDNKGVLPGGEPFAGPAELKRILLTRNRDLFARNATEKMLSYALGRELEFFDTHSVNQIVEKLKTGRYAVHTLIVEVAKSYPFNYRRTAPVQQD